MTAECFGYCGFLLTCIDTGGVGAMVSRGNIFVLSTGEVALLDCGQVKQINTLQRLKLARLVVMVHRWEQVDRMLRKAKAKAGTGGGGSTSNDTDSQRDGFAASSIRSKVVATEVVAPSQAIGNDLGSAGSTGSSSPSSHVSTGSTGSSSPSSHVSTGSTGSSSPSSHVSTAAGGQRVVVQGATTTTVAPPPLGSLSIDELEEQRSSLTLQLAQEVKSFGEICTYSHY